MVHTRLIEDGVRVDRRAEVAAAGRKSTGDTGFCGQREVVEDVLFGRDAGDGTVTLLGAGDLEGSVG